MREQHCVRAVALGAALAGSALLTIYPRVLGSRLETVTHAALPLLLFGISAAFVIGVGYVPDRRWARAVFHPAMCALAITAALVAIGWSRI
ncbi:hypothetical protein BH10PSE17_BH10PSE17_20060 [soil metagenome]